MECPLADASHFRQLHEAIEKSPPHAGTKKASQRPLILLLFLSLPSPARPMGLFTIASFRCLQCFAQLRWSFHSLTRKLDRSALRRFDSLNKALQCFTDAIATALPHAPDEQFKSNCSSVIASAVQHVTGIPSISTQAFIRFMLSPFYPISFDLKTADLRQLLTPELKNPSPLPAYSTKSQRLINSDNPNQTNSITHTIQMIC